MYSNTNKKEKDSLKNLPLISSPVYVAVVVVVVQAVGVVLGLQLSSGGTCVARLIDRRGRGAPVPPVREGRECRANFHTKFVRSSAKGCSFSAVSAPIFASK